MLRKELQKQILDLSKS